MSVGSRGRFLDTEEVTGSNPVSPTIDIQPLTSGNADQGLFLCGRRAIPVRLHAVHLSGGGDRRRRLLIHRLGGAGSVSPERKTRGNLPADKADDEDRYANVYRMPRP
jgi:hypothetical protein